MADNIPNAFAQWLLSKDSKKFGRLRTQSLSTPEQFIIDGFGLSTEWQESAITNGGFRYAELTIPAGYVLALESRILNPEKEKTYYRVYPQGTYTVNGTPANTASDYIRTGLLNTRSGILTAVGGEPFTRATVSATPNVLDSLAGATAKSYGTPSSSSGNKSEGDVGSENVFRLVGDGTEQKFLLQIENAGASQEEVTVTLVYALIPITEISPVVV